MMSSTFIILALLASFSLSPAFASSNSFSSIAWKRTYLTPETEDVLVSLTLDDGNGFAYVVGYTIGPRGSNTSFSGLVYNNRLNVRDFDSSKMFEDAVIAKVTKHDGRVVWSRRVMQQEKSRFSAVAVSLDKKTVYAAGILTQSNQTQPYITQAYDSETGDPKGMLYVSLKAGIHIVSDMVSSRTGFFICARTTDETGRISRKRFLIASQSRFGKLLWLKQGGKNLTMDSCSGLSLSEFESSLYVSGVSQRMSSSGRILTSAEVYKLSADNGMVQWAKRLQSSPGVEIRATDVVIAETALYVSGILSSDVRQGDRAYLYKLSKRFGTLLWSREACCSGVFFRQPAISDSPGKGSVAIVPGLFVNQDKYLYLIGYYRRKDATTDERFASVLVRMNIYGEQEPTRDISLPLEMFGMEASAPRKSASCGTGDSMYVVSTNRTVHGEAAGNIPNLQLVTFAMSEVKIRNRPSAGNVYINVSMEVTVKSIPITSVVDLIIERLRVDENDVRFISNQTKDSLANRSTATIYVKTYGSNAGRMDHDISNALEDLFTKTGPSMKNVFERHFGLGPNQVLFAPASLKVVAEGFSPRPQAAGENDVSTGEETRSLDWIVVGSAVGVGIVGLVILLAVIVILTRRSNNS